MGDFEGTREILVAAIRDLVPGQDFDPWIHKIYPPFPIEVPDLLAIVNFTEASPFGLEISEKRSAVLIQRKLRMSVNNRSSFESWTSQTLVHRISKPSMFNAGKMYSGRKSDWLRGLWVRMSFSCVTKCRNGSRLTWVPTMTGSLRSTL